MSLLQKESSEEGCTKKESFFSKELIVKGVVGMAFIAASSAFVAFSTTNHINNQLDEEFLSPQAEELQGVINKTQKFADDLAGDLNNQTTEELKDAFKEVREALRGVQEVLSETGEVTDTLGTQTEGLINQTKKLSKDIEDLNTSIQGLNRTLKQPELNNRGQDLLFDL